MKRNFLTLAAMILAASSARGAPANDDPQTDALAWLGLVDKMDYAESWTEASAGFRAHVTETAWEDAAKKARTPLGDLKARVFSKITLSKSLPGVPDGDYAVVQFQTVFANKAQAVETVTLTMENGAWHSAGYFIR